MAIISMNYPLPENKNLERGREGERNRDICLCKKKKSERL
jgi:hypothetical protein